MSGRILHVKRLLFAVLLSLGCAAPLMAAEPAPAPRTQDVAAQARQFIASLRHGVAIRGTRLCAEPGGIGVAQVTRGCALLAEATPATARDGKPWLHVHFLREAGAEPDAFAPQEGFVPAKDVKSARLSAMEAELVAARRFGLMKNAASPAFTAGEALTVWPRAGLPGAGRPSVTIAAGTPLKPWGMLTRTSDGTWWVRLHEPAGEQMLQVGTMRLDDFEALDFDGAEQAVRQWLAREKQLEKSAHDGGTAALASSGPCSTGRLPHARIAMPAQHCRHACVPFCIPAGCRACGGRLPHP